MGFMQDLVDVAKFEKFNAKEMWRKVKDDPERVLIGAGDPASSKFWGKVTGKDYEPIVDQWGGASNDTYDKAHAAGVRTGPGKTMHHIARAIAAYYAGGYAMNALGGGAAAGGAGGGAGSAGSAGAGGAPFIPGVDSAAVGSSGSAVVPSSVNLTNAGGTMSTGGGAAGASWTDWVDMAGNQMQQQPEQEKPVEPEPVRFEEEEPLYVRSSKEAKAPGGGMAAIARGVAGEDPIDANGVQISAIKALSDRLARAKSQLAKLKGANA
jgi:hypothetical protein